MKVKLNLSLPAAAVMLFMLAVTGYAHPTHSDRPETTGNIALENPDRVTLSDKAKLGPEVTGNTAVENSPPTSEITSTKDSLVSKWLEARATEEAVVREAGAGKSSFEAAPLPMEMGYGWCNLCGCWMRHGCDSNGNCDISHLAVCGGGPDCYIHPDDNCTAQ